MMIDLYNMGTGSNLDLAGTGGRLMDVSQEDFEDCCCGECEWCSDGGPSSWSVVLSGFQLSDPEDCADCLDLNDTFVCDIYPGEHSAIDPDCMWGYDFSGTVCNANWMFLRAQDYPVSGYQIDVILFYNVGTQVIGWRKIYGESKPACKTLSSVQLDYWFENAIWDTGCDNTANTKATITAL